MENKEYIQQLLEKYLADTASEEELQLLFTALSRSKENQPWEELLLPVFENGKPDKAYHAAGWEPIINAIIHSQAAAPARVRRIPVFVRFASAAAIIAAVATSVVLWQHQSPSVKNGQLAANDIAPASNKAVLTLADGSTIVLDSAATGHLTRQGGSEVIKGSGSLTYSHSQPATAGVMQYNTLSTPRGGQFNLVLPDGSHVWLNAASSIRYPVAFAGKERHVEVSGEAYFEIATNASAPFTVHTAQQDIQVLGTSFNLNAYADEGATRTTLIDGSVKVTAQQQTAGYVLKPGQQLQVQDNHVNLIPDVNIQQVVAWKNGQLDMNNLDIKALMRQLSRWYDVEVVFEGALPAGRFGGLLDHKVYLSNIVEVLESQGIRCRLEGKTLHISK